jgi:hypothetical protein
VSIPTRVVSNALLAATITGFDVPSQDGRATILHGAQHAALSD